MYYLFIYLFKGCWPHHVTRYIPLPVAVTVTIPPRPLASYECALDYFVTALVPAGRGLYAGSYP